MSERIQRFTPNLATVFTIKDTLIMPNAMYNDAIFVMNNTADVDVPAMNSVDGQVLMPPPVTRPATNRGDSEGLMPPPAPRPMSLGSDEGGGVISAARLEDTSCATPRADLAAIRSEDSSCDTPIAVAHTGGWTMSSSVVSSLTDGSPPVIEGQGESQKKTLVVGQRFLPDRESEITDEFAKDNFLKDANHFDKSIPYTCNPTEEHLGKCKKVMSAIHTNIRNLLHDQILNLLQSESRKHGLLDKNNKPGKDVSTIHFLALKMKDKECMETYLQRVLIFLKIPQKHNLEWVNNVKTRVKEQYDIRWPHSGETNFVERIARVLFFNIWNQRMRRFMWREAMIIWYERLPAIIAREKVYQNTRVEVSSRDILITGEHLIKGNLVQRVSGDAVVAKLSKVSPVTMSKEDYMKEALRLWKEEGVCELA